MTNVQRSISLDQELWSEIDEQRGDVSRSRFIATIVAEVLGASNKESSQVIQVQDPKERKKQ